MPPRRTEYATLDWKISDTGPYAGQAMPYSSRFDDIYFANEPIAETNHVFLEGNALPQRFKETSQFSIGETGFGSGLNFLCAWALWDKQEKPDDAHLHFLSFEKFPLHLDDLKKIHGLWPELSPYTSALQQEWPVNITGFHQLNFSRNVSLTLYLGDIEDGLGSIMAPLRPIDAWFLDGFSPAKNPQLWNRDLYHAIASLSAHGTTLSTFTVAGHVRRGLTQAGFTVEKADGFGKKRNMLRGILKPKMPPCTDNTQKKPLQQTKKQETKTSPHHPSSQNEPWFSHQNLTPLQMGAKIAIIGAGIAGASLAYALRQQGFSPIIFETRKPANGASGNKAGLITPRLDYDDKAEARFYLHAWLHTYKLLEKLQRQNRTISLFNQCGISRLKTRNQTAEQIQKILTLNILPKGWLEKVEDGIFMPQSGVVSPPDFVNLLIADTPIISAHVQSITKQEQGVTLHANDGYTSHHADAVIIANGVGALQFLSARGLPLQASLGQIDIYPDVTSPPHGVSCGPYIAPLPTTKKSNTKTQKGLVIGATYKFFKPHDTPSTHLQNNPSCENQSELHPSNHPLKTSVEAACENIDRMKQYYPDLVASLDPQKAHSRASLRCMTPDFSPIVGAVPDWAFYSGAYDGLRQGKIHDYPLARYQPNIYILSGLGSRGLVTAPLAASMIAAQISGGPAPVDQDIYHALHAGRFFIRSLKKAKTIKP